MFIRLAGILIGCLFAFHPAVADASRILPGFSLSRSIEWGGQNGTRSQATTEPGLWQVTGREFSGFSSQDSDVTETEVRFAADVRDGAYGSSTSQLSLTFFVEGPSDWAIVGRATGGTTIRVTARPFTQPTSLLDVTLPTTLNGLGTEVKTLTPSVRLLRRRRYTLDIFTTSSFPDNQVDFRFVAVPEPGTALLLGLGLVGISTRARRQSGGGVDRKG